MLLAVTTDNVGRHVGRGRGHHDHLGVARPLHRTRASLEASYKYLLICSVGIALAFVGTVLVYFDFAQRWRGETEARAALDAAHVGGAAAARRRWCELAFVFLLVGYGTKAGLAPMHTWLPDAHGEAPAALSAP